MALVLLEQHTASTSASLDFTAWYSASYDEYEIHFINIIPATNNVSILLLCSTNGGSSYDTGANYNSNDFEFVSGATGTGGGGAGQTAITLARTVKNDNGLSMRLILTSPGSTALNKFFFGVGISYDNIGPRYLGWQIAGVYVNTTAVNAFRILPSGGGNLTSGTVRVYGVSTS